MKIAIVQDGPVHLNLPASIEKAKSYFTQAEKDNVDLLVFGECWFSGYPAWIDYCPEVALWDQAATKEVWTRMYQNSLELNGPYLQQLCDLAAQHQIYLLIGANEVIRKGKGNGSLYNALFIIDANGKIVNHHRKLMPTFTEKLIYNHGDAKGLESVSIGNHQVGGLICWEHWMPLTRQAMHDTGETIHIGIWPTVKEMNRIASRQYAFEGRCYVLAIGQIMKAEETPSELKLPNHLSEDPDAFVMQGGTCAYGPDGTEILEPLDASVLYHVLELPGPEKAIGEKLNLATSGHYQRSDVFTLEINKKRLTD